MINGDHNESGLPNFDQLEKDMEYLQEAKKQTAEAVTELLEENFENATSKLERTTIISPADGTWRIEVNETANDPDETAQIKLKQNAIPIRPSGFGINIRLVDATTDEPIAEVILPHQDEAGLFCGEIDLPFRLKVIELWQTLSNLASASNTDIDIAQRSDYGFQARIIQGLIEHDSLSSDEARHNWVSRNLRVNARGMLDLRRTPFTHSVNFVAIQPNQSGNAVQINSQRIFNSNGTKNVVGRPDDLHDEIYCAVSAVGIDNPPRDMSALVVIHELGFVDIEEPRHSSYDLSQPDNPQMDPQVLAKLTTEAINAVAGSIRVEKPAFKNEQ